MTSQAILILGMHRSGTSAVARVCNLLGVALSESLMPAIEDNNETGFWEHADIVGIHDRLLAAIRSNWDGTFPLPQDWATRPELLGLRSELISVLSRDFSATPVWGIKDPRLCRLLPWWKPALEAMQAHPHALVVLRDPREVAASLAKRDGFETDKSLLLWLLYTLEAERHSRAIPRAFVRYDALMSDWRAVVSTWAMAGIAMPKNVGAAAQEIDAFLRPNLRHHRNEAHTPFSTDARIDRWVGDAYRHLLALAAGEGDSASHWQALDMLYTDAIDVLRTVEPLAGFWFREAVRERLGNFTLRHQKDVLELQKDQQLEQQRLALQEQVENAWNVANERLAALRDETDRANGAEELVQYYQNALDQVYASTSWRVTKPLRFGIHLLKSWRSRRLWTRMAEENPYPAERRLYFEIERGLSPEIVVGSGVAHMVAGYAFNPAVEIDTIEFRLGDSVFPLAHPHDLREDVPERFADLDPRGFSVTSGFWGMLPLGSEWAGRTCPLSLVVRYADTTTESVDLGTVRLREETLYPTALPKNVVVGDDANPLVAICMAAYKPKIAHIRTQLDSIIAQTHTNWMCLVHDDASAPATFDELKTLYAHEPRIIFSRNAENLGFYRNFEEALKRAPREAQFIAFSDQDDRWYPDKIEACLKAFTPDTQLVFCDMKLVKGNGEIFSDTFWRRRKNQYTNLETLIVANTVTGAASIFRRELVETLLPFPDKIGDIFHDHWLACCALAAGRIGYVDRPLYDYLQHDNNVLGYIEIDTSHIQNRIAILLYTMGVAMKGFVFALLHPGVHKGLPSQAQHNLNVYLQEYRRLALMSRTLRIRLPAMAADKARAVNLFADQDLSLPALAGLSLRGMPRIATTFYAEGRLVGSYMVYATVRALMARTRVAVIRSLRAAKRKMEDKLPPSLHAHEFIARKISPLLPKISADEPKRINMLIPEINFRYFFGGYIGKANLALKLAKAGHRVRLITVDECKHDLDAWKEAIKDYQGLEALFDHVEVVGAYERTVPIAFHPDDAIIATTWWTGHIAHDLMRHLTRSKFLYLIQEYEPFTFPMGTFYALAHQSYSFPHDALFSTKFLLDYFEDQQFGVYSETLRNTSTGDYFENAILTFALPSLPHPGKKKVLFYARPEPHAARNMFELGFLALTQAVEQGVFPLEEWEIHGIGSPIGDLDLPRGQKLLMRGKVDLNEYQQVLPQYDLGLALMYTPHPSLLPLEMAAAGLVTVTNTCLNKRADQLTAVSPNLIAAEAGIGPLGEALRTAATRACDGTARLAGARVNWPQTWDAALDARVMGYVLERLKP